MTMKSKIETEEEEEAEVLNELKILMEFKSKINFYENRMVKAQAKINSHTISMYGFYEREQAKKIQLKWQKKTYHQFFRLGEPLRRGKNSTRIFYQIFNFVKNDNCEPIIINNLSRRSFIIALSKTLTHYGYMPQVVFKLGSTVIQFTQSSTGRQKGNFKMILPIPCITYGERCIEGLKNLIKPLWDENHANQRLRYRKFLKLFKDRLTEMKSFNYFDLNRHGNILINSELEADRFDKNIQETLHFLNGLILLVTTVEVVVRFYRQPDGSLFSYDNESEKIHDAFPVAIAQARSLILLLNGKISFADFLGETIKPGYNHNQHRAYYGVVTGIACIDHLDIMFNKLFEINKKYNKLLQTSKTWKNFCNFYLESNPEGYFVEGRSRMYFDLLFVYGAGDESDSDPRDYSKSSDSEVDDVIEFSNI